MIIDKNISEFIVFAEDRLSHALQKIEDNRHHFVIILSQSGRMEGVLTDGDFRRWVITQGRVDVTDTVGAATNREFAFGLISDPPESIAKRLTEHIEFLPLVDAQHHLIAIARKRESDLSIGNFRISKDSPTFVIAEIGNNHNGNIDTAKRLVDEAIIAGANCVKFQLRDMDSLYRNNGKSDDASADLGAQYTLDLLERFQLNRDEMAAIFDYSQQQGALPLCTPFDIVSLEFLKEYGMAAYKLASADLTNHDLLLAMVDSGVPLLCSTGMSRENEIIDATDLLKRRGAQFVLLHCNSTYPAPFKDINLRYLSRLQQIGTCHVGYSGHERGYSIAVAAVSMGAKVIEKHFTLDRNQEGNDHRVSLLPHEFKDMVEAIRAVESALGTDAERQVTQGEMMNREVLGKSLVITCDLAKDAIISGQMIDVKSPGNGLSPYHKRRLIGRRAKRDFRQGDFFFPSDIAEKQAEAREYCFRRPFGIPTRYHDFRQMLDMSNLDLVEFHLSYKDLDVDIESFLDQSYDIGFVVHSPELFAGDHILDLCSFDDEYCRHSIVELQRVIDTTRTLKHYFPKTARPLIVVNIGGATQDSHLTRTERERFYDRFRSSLRELDTEGVELIPQTMPPFPWHFGGQRYQNLFMDPNEIADFCCQNGMRVCLDVSHSKLACNYYKWSFSGFVEKVAPVTAHLHLVDADGVDSEGLQIEEGSIDFAALANGLDRFAPTASFIPEIWQGHKNEGEGFWLALERLEKWF